MSSSKTPDKILIVKPSSLGDVVHALPFLSSLRSRFPDSIIHWVIASGLEGLLEGHPMIDDLIVIDKDGWKRISGLKDTVGQLMKLSERLRSESYDLAVDLQGLLRSGLITAATGAPEKIGFAEAREGATLFYNRLVEGGANIHAVDRYMKIASALGCSDLERRFVFPELSSARELTGLDPGEPYGVLIPGARWESKIWPAERFGELASMLPVKTVVVGGKADVGRAGIIVSGSSGRAVSLSGKTSLRELAAVIKGARFAVSNDSGPMHIAAAFDVPVAALFGPTSAELTGPYGRGHLIIKGDVGCSPCFRKKCNKPECLSGISAGRVYDAIIRMVERVVS